MTDLFPANASCSGEITPALLTLEDDAALIDFFKSCPPDSSKLLCGLTEPLPDYPSIKEVTRLFLSNNDKIIEYSAEDLVLGAETSITLGTLQEHLRPYQQWLPTYAGQDSTLLDLLNYADNGCLEQGWGNIRELCLGLTLALSDGYKIKSGGKVVKNVTGYDLPKIFIGARGSLGYLTSAYLRLSALPAGQSTLFLHYEKEKECLEDAWKLLQTGLPVSCLEIINAAQLDVLTAACQQASNQESANLSKQTEQQAQLSPASPQCYLICQLHGEPETLLELEKIIRTKTSQAHDYKLINDTAEAEKFWIALSSLPHKQEHLYISFNFSLKTIYSLLQACPQTFQKRPWQMRPGKGKWFIYAPQEEAPDLLEQVDNQLKNNHLIFSSTRTTNNLTRLFERRPHSYASTQIAAEKSFKEVLKQKFDCKKLLNPFVQL